ncbi:unnamed protein product [Amoebophrya sp. A25]|nr:unnamed protein product [Amoebophrya sp. A25]|eukprot:GSA25T00008487001.1
MFPSSWFSAHSPQDRSPESDADSNSEEEESPFWGGSASRGSSRTTTTNNTRTASSSRVEEDHADSWPIASTSGNSNSSSTTKGTCSTTYHPDPELRDEEDFDVDDDPYEEEDGEPSKRPRPLRSKTANKIPILIQNPDGSIAEGRPPGYVEKGPRRAAARLGFAHNGLLWGELGAETLGSELGFLYQRHETLFLGLLLTEFFAEIGFFIVYWHNWPQAVEELTVVYGRFRREGVETSLMVAFWLRLVYTVGYYAFAAIVVTTRKPDAFKCFASYSLVGIVLELGVTYLNKFNLVVFFLRLLSYLYSKFLRSVAQHMAVLRADGTVFPQPTFFGPSIGDRLGTDGLGNGPQQQAADGGQQQRSSATLGNSRLRDAPAPSLHEWLAEDDSQLSSRGANGNDDETSRLLMASMFEDSHVGQDGTLTLSEGPPIIDVSGSDRYAGRPYDDRSISRGVHPYSAVI